MNRDILTRYFQGECTENEKIAIREWLECDEKHPAQFVRERIRFDASLMIEEQHFAALPVRRSIPWKTWWAVAVILLLFMFNLYRPSQPDTVMQSVYVAPGSRSAVTLPDGSSVWLNSNTTLRYPNQFSGKERAVELDGEAWFDVAQHASKTFIVRTGKYHLEVLGTTFNVEAYSHTKSFATALFTGKVKLYKAYDDTHAYYLSAGESTALAGDTLCFSAANPNVCRWRDGLIVIEDQSFEEIMRTFEKYFGWQIVIKNNKVQTLGYRGKLRIADGVEHALRVLQNDFRFSYTREESSNIIYIY